MLGSLDENLRDDDVSLVNSVATSSSPYRSNIYDALAILDRNVQANKQHSLDADSVDESSPTNPMEDNNNLKIKK